MIVLAIIRLILLMAVLATYVLVVFILSPFFGGIQKASYGLRRPTIKVFLRLLGVRTHVSGDIPDGTVLFVGNHISYLDPFVLVRYCMASPVAKSEVAGWPVVGYVVSISGVIFVKRRNASSLRNTRSVIAETIRGGQSVIVYPEGTTGTGRGLLPFQKGIFDLAEKNDFQIVPVTIAHQRHEAAFLRDDTFVPHFLRLFGFWRNHVYIHFSPALKQTEGRELLNTCRSEVRGTLTDLKKHHGI